MASPIRGWIFVILIAAALLSACDSNTVLDSPDQGMEEDSAPAPPAGGAEGSANIYYHYYLTVDSVDFKIDVHIPVGIAESDQVGSWDVNGIGQAKTQLDMKAGGGPTGSCQVQCELYLNFAADGEVTLDPNTGGCTIPIRFTFVPQQDESILTGDCPEEAMATMDCAVLSMVMMDPSQYTFTKSKRDVKQDTDPAVTLKAEIRDVVFPEGLSGTCDW